MQILILAAGEGSRLRPHTLKRPKCLVPIAGKGLLDWQLEQWQNSGIKREQVCIVGGYKIDQLTATGCEIIENAEYATTNMVSTLFCADRKLTNDTIISYGDIVFNRHAIDAILTSEHAISVIIDLDWAEYWEARFENPLSDAETLRMGERGQILEIGNKPKTISEIEGQYIGLIKANTQGLIAMRNLYRSASDGRRLINGKSAEKAYMTDLLQELISDGFPIHAAPIKGGWIEVDSVQDLENPITLLRLKQISEF